MARALSEDSLLYRAVIDVTRTDGTVERCYYGPYSTPAPGKAMASQLRRHRHNKKVDYVRTEVISGWVMLVE